MGLEKGLLAPHKPHLEKSADNPGGVSVSEQANRYISELLETYPTLPQGLTESPYASSIYTLLSNTIEAQNEHGQMLKEAQRLLDHTNMLAIRLAATVALARGDMSFLLSLASSPEAKKAFPKLVEGDTAQIEELADMTFFPELL